MRTTKDFLAELRRLRAQAGDPSFRRLHRIAGKLIADAPTGYRMDPLATSTTSEVLAGKRLPRLPRLEFVESYVAACLSSSGVDEPAVDAEVARWRTLWHSLTTPREPEEPANTVRVKRPRPSLTLLLIAVFLAGLAVGVVCARGWSVRHAPMAGVASAEASADPPDVCLAAGAAPPMGNDVLMLPPAGQETGSWWVNDAGAATMETDGRRFRADVAAGTSRPGDVIIVRSDVALIEGRPYALSFSATADRSTTIRVRVQDSQPPAYLSSYDREVSVDQGTCLHLYRFVARRTSAHSELTFQVGGRPQDFQLRVGDTSLVETPA